MRCCIRIDRNGEPVGGGIEIVIEATGGGDQSGFRIQSESTSAIFDQSQIRVARSIAHAHEDMGHFRSTG